MKAIVDEEGNWADENNDTFASASELTDKKAVIGLINDEADVDCYKYEVSTTNPFTFNLTCLEEQGGRWDYYVYDEDARTILWSVTTDSNTFNTETQRFMFEKGHILYVKIVKYAYSSTASHRKYQLSTKIDDSAGWGKENNDTNDSANAVNSAEPVKGIIANNNDADWYVYSVPNTDNFSFTFLNTESKGGSWNIYIYDSNLKNTIWSYTSSRGEYSITTDKFKAKKGDKIYVKITNYVYGSSAVDKVYQLQANDTAKAVTVKKASIAYKYTCEDKCCGRKGNAGCYSICSVQQKEV